MIVLLYIASIAIAIAGLLLGYTTTTNTIDTIDVCTVLDGNSEETLSTEIN